jgi:hypothetical protein
MTFNLFKMMTATMLSALPMTAIAAETPCLTATEARGLIQVALPDVITAVESRCKTTLPSGSFLARSGAEMATRYRTSAGTNWPVAKLAFLKLVGPSGEVFKSMPDDASKALISAGIAAEMGKGIKPEQCSYIDRAMAALAPLPPENMADLTIVILELGNANGAKTKSPLTLCPAPQPIAGTAIVNKPTASAQ